jgi:hypothetical protein
LSKYKTARQRDVKFVSLSKAKLYCGGTHPTTTIAAIVLLQADTGVLLEVRAVADVA